MSKVKESCDDVRRKLGAVRCETIWTDEECIAYTMNIMMNRIDRLGERLETVEHQVGIEPKEGYVE